MEIWARFLKLNISEDEYYTNMADYIGHVLVFNTAFYYKQPTSFYNPTLIIEHDFLETASCNYVAIDYVDQPDPGQAATHNYKYYFIEDVRTISATTCEVDLKFVAFRTCPWRNANTKLQLAYSSRESDWSTTCDEPRFDPYSVQGEFMGSVRGLRRKKFLTGIHASDDGNTDIEGHTVDESYGVYLVNWWWGYNAPNGSLGMVYGAMSKNNFDMFIGGLVQFVVDNPGSILHGDLDYTKWVISARWFPSLKLSDFANVGYSKVTGVGVGGLAPLNSVTCYLRQNSPGYLYGFSAIPAGPLEVLGGTSLTVAQTENVNKLKFLLQDKWSKMVVSTPVGIGEIPLERLRLGFSTDSSQVATKIGVYSQIDLGTGTMRMVFNSEFLDGYMGSQDTLLSLSGPISIDVKNQFTHVASDKEVVTMALPDIANGIISGAAQGGGAVGGILGGATSLVNKMTSPRRYNIHISGQNDIKYLASNNMSLKEFTVNTLVYLNEDTPIWDSQNVEDGNAGWNANRVYTSYSNWCKQMHHGFPSIKWINCSGLTPSAPDYEMYIKAQNVNDVYVYDYPHWCEEEIARKLMQGVVIKTYDPTP